MNRSRSSVGGYILALVVGAIGGGVAVAALTHAIPAMMRRVMPEMMQGIMPGMIEQMSGEGCSPEEM